MAMISFLFLSAAINREPLKFVALGKGFCIGTGALDGSCQMRNPSFLAMKGWGDGRRRGTKSETLEAARIQ